MALTRAQRYRSLAGVIAAMAVVNLVYGITFPLLALVLDAQGVSKTLIGLNTVVQAAAIILVAPWTPELLRRFAPSRIMQVAAAALAGLLMLAGLFQNVWFWFPLRLVVGALTALLWIASEALINDLADEHRRGRVVSLYVAVGAAGFALGPLLLILTGSSGLLPFAVTSGLILAAALPLFAVHRHTLTPAERLSGGLWRAFRLAPAVMLGNLVYAAVAESLLTFFPLFGIGLGVGEHFALGLMTLMGLGTVFLMLPLGWLADRADRMGLMAAFVCLTIAGLLAMPLVIRESWTAGVFAFAFGGVEGMIYALGVMLVGQNFKGAQLAGATTLFTACWGAGTVLGPLLAGAGMDLLGSDRLALILALFLVVYLPLPLASFLRRRKSRP